MGPCTTESSPRPRGAAHRVRAHMRPYQLARAAEGLGGGAPAFAIPIHSRQGTAAGGSCYPHHKLPLDESDSGASGSDLHRAGGAAHRAGAAAEGFLVGSRQSTRPNTSATSNRPRSNYHDGQASRGGPPGGGGARATAHAAHGGAGRGYEGPPARYSAGDGASGGRGGGSAHSSNCPGGPRPSSPDGWGAAGPRLSTGAQSLGGNSSANYSAGGLSAGTNFSATGGRIGCSLQHEGAFPAAGSRPIFSYQHPAAELFDGGTGVVVPNRRSDDVYWSGSAHQRAGGRRRGSVEFVEKDPQHQRTIHEPRKPSTAGTLEAGRRGGQLADASVTQSVIAQGRPKTSWSTSGSSSGGGGADSRSEGDGGSVLPSPPEWHAQFYKTKMCPFMQAAGGNPQQPGGAGVCLNGAECRFAHSEAELRPLPDLRQTKLCPSYAKRVRCTTEGCPFAHTPEELRTSSTVFYKVALCNFYRTKKCWNGPNCRFAHGTQELRSLMGMPSKRGGDTTPTSVGGGGPGGDQEAPSASTPTAGGNRQLGGRRKRRGGAATEHRHPAKATDQSCSAGRSTPAAADTSVTEAPTSSWSLEDSVVFNLASRESPPAETTAVAATDRFALPGTAPTGSGSGGSSRSARDRRTNDSHNTALANMERRSSPEGGGDAVPTYAENCLIRQRGFIGGQFAPAAAGSGGCGGNRDEEAEEEWCRQLLSAAVRHHDTMTAQCKLGVDGGFARSSSSARQAPQQRCRHADYENQDEGCFGCQGQRPPPAATLPQPLEAGSNYLASSLVATTPPPTAVLHQATSSSYAQEEGRLRDSGGDQERLAATHAYPQQLLPSVPVRPRQGRTPLYRDAYYRHETADFPDGDRGDSEYLGRQPPPGSAVELSCDGTAAAFGIRNDIRLGGDSILLSQGGSKQTFSGRVATRDFPSMSSVSAAAGYSPTDTVSTTATSRRTLVATATGGASGSGFKAAERLAANATNDAVTAEDKNNNGGDDCSGGTIFIGGPPASGGRRIPSAQRPCAPRDSECTGAAASPTTSIDLAASNQDQQQFLNQSSRYLITQECDDDDGDDDDDQSHRRQPSGSSQVRRRGEHGRADDDDGSRAAASTRRNVGGSQASLHSASNLLSNLRAVEAGSSAAKVDIDSLLSLFSEALADHASGASFGPAEPTASGLGVASGELLAAPHRDRPWSGGGAGSPPPTQEYDQHLQLLEIVLNGLEGGPSPSAELL